MSRDGAPAAPPTRTLSRRIGRATLRQARSRFLQEFPVSLRPVVRRHAPALPLVLLLAVSVGTAYAVPAAQAPAKKAIAVDDYTKWKSVNDPELSGDGKWVTYGISLTNTVAAESKPVLHLKNLETNQHVEVNDASGGNFSADSKWIAYTVDPSAGGRGGRGGRAGGGAGTPAPGGPTPPATLTHPPTPPSPHSPIDPLTAAP